jgi:RNA polymerase sigma factor (TIGR02999 family)
MGEEVVKVCQKFHLKSDKIFAVATEGCDSVNRLMTELRGGSPEAAGKLVELFYPELRRLATARMMRERSDHTWQPTVLVNELYVELTRIKALPPGSSHDEEEKDAFFGLASFLMRRLLLHHARPLPKRVMKTEISEALGLAVSGTQALHEVEELLRRLGAIDANLRAVVEMKAFEGLSREEIAQRLGCSVRTVARHWEFAQHWLQKAMSGDGRA